MFEPVTIYEKISTVCDFCDISDIWMERRIFYRDKNWYAFLAAPFHTKGHTILAAIRKGSKCPKEPSEEVLGGLSIALVKTINLIKKCYQPKDVLLSSLRGSESHFHFHLVPLWEHEEKDWRDKQKCQEQYKKGHLMEFLGFLEKTISKKVETERKKGSSEEEQRKKIIILLRPEVEKLRATAGFLIDP